jgi:hypothetical protein
MDYLRRNSPIIHHSEGGDCDCGGERLKAEASRIIEEAKKQVEGMIFGG